MKNTFISIVLLAIIIYFAAGFSVAFTDTTCKKNAFGTLVCETDKRNESNRVVTWKRNAFGNLVSSEGTVCKENAFGTIICK